MNHSLISYAMVFSVLVATGCRSSTLTGKAPDLPQQLDEGSYVMNNHKGIPLAWMFAFKNEAAGTMVEYWAKSASWADRVELNINADTRASCSDWRKNVCLDKDVKVYRTDVPLEGSSVDALCKEPTKREKTDTTNRFLSGAYEIKSSDKTIAWIYAGDDYDIWVMTGKLKRDASSAALIGALSPTSDFKNADGFIPYVCGLNPRPKLVFEPQYTPVLNFCQTAPPDCQ